jgi:hypothetical protein
MEPLNLQMRPVQAVSTALEASEFRLVLQNPNAADVPIPADWFAGLRIGIFHPDGERTMVAPFGSNTVPDATSNDEILGNSERERRFTLPGAALPGLYVLLANLTVGQAMHAAAKWYLEAPQPLSLAINSAGGALGERAWILSPGDKQTTLFQTSIGWCDVSEPSPVRTGHPGRLALLDRAAHGLVACDLPAFSPERQFQRVAWLSGADTLHVGSTAVLFDSSSIALPGPARRILAPLLVSEDGACDVIVLSADGRTVWAYRCAPAFARQAPPVQPPPQAGETEAEPEDWETAPVADDAEDGAAPFTPGADVPVPELVATIPLEIAASAGAVSAGANGSGLVLAADAGESIEVWLYLQDDELRPKVRSRVRIQNANLISGCDPWIELDEYGLTRVAFLFQEPGGVGLAKLAFDANAEAVWVPGVARQRVAPLAAAPSEGALAATGDSEWSLAWCVRTAENELVGSLPGGGLRRKKLTATPVHPLLLLATPDRMAVATDSGEGIAFVSV